MYEALMRLDRRRALGERLKGFLWLLERFKAGISSDGSVELSIDTARKHQDENLERDLRLLLVELGEAAQGHDTGVVLLVDEMQFLVRAELEAIAAAMHRLSQRDRRAALAREREQVRARDRHSSLLSGTPMRLQEPHLCAR